MNYLELASGSPARTPRRGRSASVESVGIPKENQLIAHKVLDPIIEDSVSVKVSVHVQKSPIDTFEIEVSGGNIFFVLIKIKFINFPLSHSSISSNGLFERICFGYKFH